MLHPVLLPAGAPAVPIHVAASLDGLPLSGPARAFLDATGFKPTPGRHAVAPDAAGAVEAVVLGVDPARPDPFALGRLPGALPPGDYALAAPRADAFLQALAFAMGSYRFTRYRASDAPRPRLVAPAETDAARLAVIADAVAAARDLINTPAGDLPPEALADAAVALADRFGAIARVIVGDALNDANFPMVHAVGRAAGRGGSRQAPRLVDFTWRGGDRLSVTLVGKGVCFDTGGLNIKPESAMLLMKKDMGGAAIALAAAEMIMALGLPIRLRVILPIVENAIAGDAFRPGDVLRSRKGVTVEIGNTDAEGRLILADALTLATEEGPSDLLIDYATLTGAARVALGPDLPAMFATNDALASDLAAAGEAVVDPVWRLPFHTPYDAMLDSKVADVNHVSSGGFAGAITAALFLKRFVPAEQAYAHIDTFAWRPAPLPGRPEGGEPQTARLTLELIERRLATTA
jgi:leucyl aminopeptidase